jgi:hypothetical protein
MNNNTQLSRRRLERVRARLGDGDLDDAGVIDVEDSAACVPIEMQFLV